MTTQLEKIQEYYTRRHIGKKIAKSYKKKAKIDNIKNFYDEQEAIIFKFVEDDESEKQPITDNEDYKQKKAIQISYAEKSKIKKQVKHFKKMAREDVMYRILNNLSSRATSELKKKKTSRTLTHLELIGCELEELKSHLEKLFEEGMTFENYGKWEVDHFDPVSSFDLTDIDEVKKCFHYKNLQPLWMRDNRVKGSKIIKKEVKDDVVDI
jgi:hypothetical protein